MDDPTDPNAANASNSSSLELPRWRDLQSSLRSPSTWVGDYDYKSLCLPRIPFINQKPPRSIFFGLHDRIPILVAIVMGFQHSLAMAGSIVSVPRIIVGGGYNHLNLDDKTQSYLISTALTVCGFMTLIQILRFRLFKGYFLGTGLISMSGTSFSFLPIAEAMITALRDEGACGEPGTFSPCPRSVYGKWLGTVALCSLLEIAISFLPPSVLAAVFPPIVSGTTVFLIGASLTGVGVKYWAGGAGPCYSYKKIEQLGGDPSNLSFFATCPNSLASPSHPWGDAHWIGLGFFVFSIIVLIAIFGSPFMRNIQVMIGLISGIVLAAATGYLNQGFIDASPAITFPWVETFPLGIYWPAVIPTLIAFVVTSVETIGDISASAEASRVATSGPEFDSRVQGGLLADGLNSLIAALMTANPTTTFSQNNGVIAVTRTANKYAGIAGAIWLIFYGIIGKVGGIFGATPDAVIGGMTTFLFANVAVSGLSILSPLKWTVRNRFIVAISIGLGFGVIIEPKALSTFLPTTTNSTLKGLRQAAVIVLETGYSLGALAAVFLNFVLPQEGEEILASNFTRGKQIEEENDQISDELGGTPEK